MKLFGRSSIERNTVRRDAITDRCGAVLELQG
jgi:hypothetical protein